jgi:uncharacterized protein YllA (UPF0747 family)
LGEVNKIGERIRKIFDELVPVVLGVDKGLQTAVEKTLTHINSNVEGFKKRVLDTLKSKEEVVATRLARVMGALRPGGQLQERQYSFLPFLSDVLVDQMIEATDPFVFGHKLLYP